MKGALGRGADLLAWGLAGVFLIAGGTKLLDPTAFATAVANYRLLPPVGVAMVAIALPWWEVAAAAALLAPRWRRAGALLVFGYSAVFLVAVGSAWARGLDIACGCFGAGGHAVGWITFGVDLACLTAAAIVLFLEASRAGVRTNS